MAMVNEASEAVQLGVHGDSPPLFHNEKGVRYDKSADSGWFDRPDAQLNAGVASCSEATGICPSLTRADPGIVETVSNEPVIYRRSARLLNKLPLNYRSIQTVGTSGDVLSATEAGYWGKSHDNLPAINNDRFGDGGDFVPPWRLGGAALAERKRLPATIGTRSGVKQNVNMVLQTPGKNPQNVGNVMQSVSGFLQDFGNLPRLSEARINASGTSLMNNTRDILRPTNHETAGADNEMISAAAEQLLSKSPGQLFREYGETTEDDFETVMVDKVQTAFRSEPSKHNTNFDCLVSDAGRRAYRPNDREFQIPTNSYTT